MVCVRKRWHRTKQVSRKEAYVAASLRTAWTHRILTNTKCTFILSVQYALMVSVVLEVCVWGMCIVHGAELEALTQWNVFRFMDVSQNYYVDVHNFPVRSN